LKNNISTITVGRVPMIHRDPKEILEEIEDVSRKIEDFISKIKNLLL
jgi:hypothetical protein